MGIFQQSFKSQMIEKFKTELFVQVSVEHLLAKTKVMKYVNLKHVILVKKNLLISFFKKLTIIFYLFVSKYFFFIFCSFE